MYIQNGGNGGAEIAFLSLRRAAGKQERGLPLDLINTAEILSGVSELWPHSLARLYDSMTTLNILVEFR